MPFDVQGARKAGYSDAEIADYLAGEQKFDIQGARKSGYRDAEIIQHLSSGKQAAPKAASASPNAKDPRARIADAAAGAFQGAIPDTLAGIVGTLTDLSGAVKGMYTNARDSLRDAQSAFKLGDYTQALSSAGAAIPIVGQAAEPILNTLAYSDSDYDRGRALGQAGAAIFGPKAVSAAGKAVAKAKPAVSGALREFAETQYKRAMDPTKEGNKMRADAVAPMLMDNNVKGSLRSMRDQTLAKVKELGQQIGAAWDNIPDDQAVPVNDLLRQMNEARAKLMTKRADGTMGPASDAAATEIGKLDSLTQILRESAEDITLTNANGTVTSMPVINAKTLRDLKRNWQKAADKAGAYEKVDPAKSSAAQYHDAANRVMGVLDAEYPDLAKLNKEFSAWKDANRVLRDTTQRKTGQSGILQAAFATGMGGAAGLISGSVAEGVGTAIAFNALQKLVTSPTWRSTSAIYKRRLATAIAEQNPGKVMQVIGEATKQSPRALSGDQQRQRLGDLVPQ